MRNLNIWIMLLFMVVAFLFNLLGLMNLVSIFITSPLLFLSILIFMIYLNERNRFRGF